jgi:hypothetical protein
MIGVEVGQEGGGEAVDVEPGGRGATHHPGAGVEQKGAFADHHGVGWA